MAFALPNERNFPLHKTAGVPKSRPDPPTQSRAPIGSLRSGSVYKFAITTESGKILYKADPFAFSAEYRPGTASVTADIEGFNWTDSDWVTKRTAQDVQKLPMSIYEVHLGSWRKKNREEKDGFYTYSEAAHELAAYVKEMGYTHVELMGIAEHSCHLRSLHCI